jgi:hypothetical protein
MYITINTEISKTVDELTGLETIIPIYCFTVHDQFKPGVSYPVFSEHATDLHELQSFIKLYRAIQSGEWYRG